MKIKYIITLVGLAVSMRASAWTPAGDKIMTSWGESLDPSSVWQEYPRPIMERAEWKNLNGLWDYAIVPAGTSGGAVEFDGQILVPFCAESALSGVGKEVGEENALWYRRDFTVPASWKGRNVLLNFGAVD